MTLAKILDYGGQDLGYPIALHTPLEILEYCKSYMCALFVQGVALSMWGLSHYDNYSKFKGI